MFLKKNKFYILSVLLVVLYAPLISIMFVASFDEGISLWDKIVIILMLGLPTIQGMATGVYCLNYKKEMEK